MIIYLGELPEFTCKDVYTQISHSKQHFVVCTRNVWQPLWTGLKLRRKIVTRPRRNGEYRKKPPKWFVQQRLLTIFNYLNWNKMVTWELCTGRLQNNHEFDKHRYSVDWLPKKVLLLDIGQVIHVASNSCTCRNAPARSRQAEELNGSNLFEFEFEFARIICLKLVLSPLSFYSGQLEPGSDTWISLWSSCYGRYKLHAHDISHYGDEKGTAFGWRRGGLEREEREGGWTGGVASNV